MIVEEREFRHGALVLELGDRAFLDGKDNNVLTTDTDLRYDERGSTIIKHNIDITANTQHNT